MRVQLRIHKPLMWAGHEGASRFQLHGDFDHTPEVFAAAKTAEETHTEADGLKHLARIGPTDAVYERGKSVQLLLVLEAKSDLVNAESIARAAGGNGRVVCCITTKSVVPGGLCHATCNGGRDLVPENPARKLPFHVKVKLALPKITEVPAKFLAELSVNAPFRKRDEGHFGRTLAQLNFGPKRVIIKGRRRLALRQVANGVSDLLSWISGAPELSASAESEALYAGMPAGAVPVRGSGAEGGACFRGRTFEAGCAPHGAAQRRIRRQTKNLQGQCRHESGGFLGTVSSLNTRSNEQLDEHSAGGAGYHHSSCGTHLRCSSTYRRRCPWCASLDQLLVDRPRRNIQRRPR